VARRAARERSRALPLVVEALARLGRLAAADSVVASAGTLDDVDARAVQRALAVGWLRAGEADRAVRAFPALADDDELRGWHALLLGDLAVARRALARAGSREPVLVTALTIVARTPVLRSDAIAAVVRALSVRDTAALLAACDRAAEAHADAAPALLTLAARLAPGDQALARWRTILARYPKTVDAPEAALELARATARHGDGTAAIPLYEQMILDYPDSALVPMARRELDALRRATPGPGARLP
jgi:tetratricopeptide (TPR) repeat protein